jgi:acetylornithine deacetylase
MIETTRLLRDLVALPSVNPMGRPLRGPTFLEGRVTDYLEAYFRTLGVRYQRDNVAPGRDNIVAFHEPANASRTLIFEAHQDTVPTDGMIIDPFGAHIEQGLLFGRGACDVKGGMAAMLTAFARRVRDNISGGARLLMACTVDEEHTFLGIQHFVANAVYQAPGQNVEAVVAEPTLLRIVKAHKGVARWSVTTAGRSCHSSRPEQGVNAIYHMAALLPRIEAYAEQLCRDTIDPVLGPATLSVGRIEGGASVNTVPDFCRIEIDRRLIPGEEGQAARAHFVDYLARHTPAEIKAIDTVRGSHIVEVVPYGTDASTLSLAGVPAVVFGPGDIARAHTCDESIPLAEVEEASEILYRLACMG